MYSDDEMLQELKEIGDAAASLLNRLRSWHAKAPRIDAGLFGCDAVDLARTLNRTEDERAWRAARLKNLTSQG